MQDATWNLQHSASEHIPGKLSLCIGLPVMIWNNDATELCITKGQEGHVGWKSGIESRGQLVLETLYVKLDWPAKNLNIEGLPENVVPLMKIKKSVKLLSSEFRWRCRVRSRARRWLQLVGWAALLMDASNFGGPDGVGESGVEPRRSLRKMRVS